MKLQLWSGKSGFPTGFTETGAREFPWNGRKQCTIFDSLLRAFCFPVTLKTNFTSSRLLQIFAC